MLLLTSLKKGNGSRLLLEIRSKTLLIMQQINLIFHTFSVYNISLQLSIVFHKLYRKRREPIGIDDLLSGLLAHLDNKITEDTLILVGIWMPMGMLVAAGVSFFRFRESLVLRINAQLLPYSLFSCLYSMPA